MRESEREYVEWILCKLHELIDTNFQNRWHVNVRAMCYCMCSPQRNGQHRKFPFRFQYCIRFGIGCHTMAAVTQCELRYPFGTDSNLKLIMKWITNQAIESCANKRIAMSTISKKNRSQPVVYRFSVRTESKTSINRIRMVCVCVSACIVFVQIL